MAIPTFEIINALRNTATILENGSRFEWGHMGRCNCGHLAQTITHFTQDEIHKFAMQKRGDWSDQLIDYCPTSGYPMDLIIQKMIQFGFSKDDLTDLEWLSNVEIVDKIGLKRSLERNNKQDTIVYMRAWAEILEEKLLKEMPLNIEFETEISTKVS